MSHIKIQNTFVAIEFCQPFTGAFGQQHHEEPESIMTCFAFIMRMIHPQRLRRSQIKTVH